MNLNRQFWNQQQAELQTALSSGNNAQAAIALFLRQHAMVHVAEMASSGLWSFADEVLQDCDDERLRCIPQGGEHSMAWIVWHLARIEDVTLNVLVAGGDEVLNEDDWLARIHSPIRHTGNAMDVEAVARLSAAVDLEALLAYRIAVGRRTRQIVQGLEAADFKRKVDAARLQRVRDEGAVIAAAEEIVLYWGKRTIAGLLLMPPTRHNFLHLNEALRIKQKCH